MDTRRGRPKGRPSIYGPSCRRSFSLPEDLLRQLEDRARLGRRSTNQEVVALLEQAIDRMVEADLEVISTLRTGRP